MTRRLVLLCAVAAGCGSHPTSAPPSPATSTYTSEPTTAVPTPTPDRAPLSAGDAGSPAAASDGSVQLPDAGRAGAVTPGR